MANDFRTYGDARRQIGEPPSGSRGPVLWTIVAVAAIVLGVILWFVFRPAPLTPPSEKAAAPAPVAETTQEVSPAKPLENLPSLDGSDAIVRGVLKALSARPEFVTWLANENLVRTFVAIVQNAAEGTSPKALLGDFTPTSPFRAAGRGTRFTADPRSFARYDHLADAFASLDEAGTARALVQLQPLCESAYRELGVPGTFREALERAFGRLLATPDVPASAPLTWNYATYQYADPKIEALSGVEKQLLRMGPRNEKIVKDKLQALAIAMRIIPKAP